MAAADVTQLLIAHREASPGAFDRLVEAVYDDLRQLARRQLRRSPSRTLNTTGLVHEAYLKLVDQTRASWHDRGHFFAVSAIAMRQILVDHARTRLAKKRGAGGHHTGLDGIEVAVDREAEQIVAVDQVLGRLASLGERMVRVVECRYFAGLTEDETAEALGASRRTVQRDWLRARAWLKTELSRRPPEDDRPPTTEIS